MPNIRPNVIKDPPQSDGQTDLEEIFNLDISDRDFITYASNALTKAKAAWDSDFNLTENRAVSTKLWLGDHYEEYELYEHETPVVDNRIFISLESNLNYATGEIANPEVYPGGGEVNSKPSEASQIMAKDVRMALKAHAADDRMKIKAKRITRMCEIKQIGVSKLRFDKAQDKIVSEVVDPDKIVFDRAAKEGIAPRFVGEYVSMSVEEMIAMWPEKKAEIFKLCDIKQGTPNQVQARYDVVEFWWHFYEGSEKIHAVAWFFKNIVLGKMKNPNWNYKQSAESKANFLPEPPMPYIFMNHINDGQSIIDPTTTILQASSLQYALNKNNRIILDNAEAGNGSLVLSGKAIQKKEAENLVGSPREKIVVDADDVRTAAMRLAPDLLPDSVFRNKMDLRQEIDNIFGTSNVFRGEGGGNATLGQDVIQKEQSQTRQNDLVDAIDDFMERYYRLVVQFMKVYYTKEHWYQVTGDNGDFDYVMMKNDKIEDGIDIRVTAGSSVAVDKDRQQQIGMMLAKAQLIDPMTLYTDLELPDPQQRYERLIKHTLDPALMLESLKKEQFDREAFIDIETVAGGGEAEPRDIINEEHLKYHTEYFQKAEFQELKKNEPERAQKLIEHVALESETLRKMLLVAETQMPTPEEQAAMQPQVDPETGEPIAPAQPGAPAPGGAPGQPPAQTSGPQSMPLGTGQPAYPPGTPMAARSEQPGVV